MEYLADFGYINTAERIHTSPLVLECYATGMTLQGLLQCPLGKFDLLTSFMRNFDGKY